MKLNKIKRICKDEKTVFIMEQKDSAGGIYQWIGDGKALFTAEGLPAVCPQELLAIFDVPERDWDKWATNITEIRNKDLFGDSFPDEERARELDVRISFQGFELQPILDGNGEVFYIQTKYLEPLSGKENLEIFIRRAGDAVYLAVKVGLYLYGIVTPAKAPEELKRMFQMLGEG